MKMIISWILVLFPLFLPLIHHMTVSVFCLFVCCYFFFALHAHWIRKFTMVSSIPHHYYHLLLLLIQFLFYRNFFSTPSCILKLASRREEKISLQHNIREIEREKFIHFGLCCNSA